MDIPQWTEYIKRKLNLPPTTFTVTRLTGGFVNSTVRVEVAAAASVGDHIDIEPGSTYVLKHAPDHIVATNQPLSTARQATEARALEYLATAPIHDVSAESNVEVPRKVWHDLDSHVLWMTDLGQLRTLSEFLHAVSRSGDGLPSVSHLRSATPALDKERDFAQAVGRRFGGAIARLHLATLNLPEETAFQYASKEVDDDIRIYLTAITKRLLGERGYSDEAAEQLSQRIGLGMGPEPSDGAEVFSICDLWPGSLLLGPDRSSTSDSADDAYLPAEAYGAPHGRVALVDWEFAGSDHPGAEVGMLFAHVSSSILDVNFPITPPAGGAAVRAVAEARCDSFAAGFTTGYLALASKLVTRAFVRVMLQSYGRELLNNADFNKAELNDEGKDLAVGQGARVLRAIGDDEGSMDLGSAFNSSGQPGAAATSWGLEQLRPFIDIAAPKR